MSRPVASEDKVRSRWAQMEADARARAERRGRHAKALDRVDAAEAAGKRVQRRDCPDCDAPQGRIQAKDGTWKRWSGCDCSTPARTTPSAPRDVRDGAAGEFSGPREVDPDDSVPGFEDGAVFSLGDVP